MCRAVAAASPGAMSWAGATPSPNPPATSDTRNSTPPIRAYVCIDSRRGMMAVMLDTSAGRRRDSSRVGESAWRRHLVRLRSPVGVVDRCHEPPKSWLRLLLVGVDRQGEARRGERSESGEIAARDRGAERADRSRTRDVGAPTGLQRSGNHAVRDALLLHWADAIRSLRQA